MNVIWDDRFTRNGGHNGKPDTRISHCVIAVGFVIIINAWTNTHNGCPVLVFPNIRVYHATEHGDAEISKSITAHSIHWWSWRTLRNKCRTIEMRFLRNVEWKSNAWHCDLRECERYLWYRLLWFVVSALSEGCECTSNGQSNNYIAVSDI